MMDNTIPSVPQLRQRLREDLPSEAFRNVPSKALLFIPLCGVVTGIVWVTQHYQLAWYWLLAISAVLGQVYATGAFLAHDILHGSVVKSRRKADLLSYLGLYPFLVSPHLWRVWHVAAHHGNTNTARDPDTIVNLDEYHGSRLARIWTRFIPCSRQKVRGTLFFAYWFTLHGQHILWFHRHYKQWQFERYAFRQVRAVADTVGYLIFWACLWYFLGWYKGIYVVAIPMMIGNSILLSFIATEHTCMPRFPEKENHPLENSVSARVPAIVDKLNLNFSHHVEHHLFPSMNYKYTPLVRAWLRENARDHYVDPTLLSCFQTLFSSPRVYSDNDHLCYPDHVDETKIAARGLRAQLLKD